MKVLLTCALMIPAVLGAQHSPGPGAPPPRSAPAEAKQFDFLIGQWELVVKPQGTSLAARIHGLPKMVGTWKAWRALDGWGIIDELRITDESGNPRGHSHATRMYDATARCWNSAIADVARGIFTSSTGEWRDGAMIITAKGTDADGKAYLSRSRYHDITPTSFTFLQERSTDGGTAWSKALIIDAKRVSATAPR